ncbi:hypothetical protein OH77DRAFT_1584274 [Trametes cingulata]|nr:hypothetical protein OH77DRAFT_1584274 [Trametes cingulata]
MANTTYCLPSIRPPWTANPKPHLNIYLIRGATVTQGDRTHPAHGLAYLQPTRTPYPLTAPPPFHRDDNIPGAAANGVLTPNPIPASDHPPAVVGSIALRTTRLPDASAATIIPPRFPLPTPLSTPLPLMQLRKQFKLVLERDKPLAAVRRLEQLLNLCLPSPPTTTPTISETPAQDSPMGPSAHAALNDVINTADNMPELEPGKLQYPTDEEINKLDSLTPAPLLSHGPLRHRLSHRSRQTPQQTGLERTPLCPRTSLDTISGPILSCAHNFNLPGPPATRRRARKPSPPNHLSLALQALERISLDGFLNVPTPRVDEA